MDREWSARHALVLPSEGQHTKSLTALAHWLIFGSEWPARVEVQKKCVSVVYIVCFIVVCFELK